MFLAGLIAAALAFQSVPTHEATTISIVAVIGFATIGIQLHFSSTTRSKIEGMVGATLKAHEDRIENLEDSKSKLWEHVNKHSNDIVKLQTQQDMKARSHHG
jgi:hypothetical protein